MWKMVKVINNNHDGSIVGIREEPDGLAIDVKIKYLAKRINETYSVMRYKIINFRKIELNVNGKTVCEKTDKIKNAGLVINTAEIGKEHSLLINIRSEAVKHGKLYIWTNYENDIKIYDEVYNEVGYEKFIGICTGNI